MNLSISSLAQTTQTMQTPGPIMLDIAGLELTADDQRRIAHPLTGGVILFARNFKNRHQLDALTKSIRRARKDILLAVDHEGGRVQRFKTDGFTHLPTMRSLGRIWDRDPIEAAKVALAVGYILAAELRAFSIDLSFTPVLDLDYGASSVIGDRALHRDPRVVTFLAQHLNHGLLLAGMANCAKHFPGHGFVQADSHIEIPVDTRTLPQIRREDIKPYKDLGLGLRAVMTAHVIYSKVDRQPASFSKNWLQLLRSECAFDGAILSDDLTMHAAQSVGDIVQAAQMALAAGCDMLLVCNDPVKADQLLDGLSASVNLFKPESAARIAALMPSIAAGDWAQLQKNAQYRQAVKTLREALG